MFMNADRSTESFLTVISVCDCLRSPTLNKMSETLSRKHVDDKKPFRRMQLSTGAVLPDLGLETFSFYKNTQGPEHTCVHTVSVYKHTRS